MGTACKQNPQHKYAKIYARNPRGTADAYYADAGAVLKPQKGDVIAVWFSCGAASAVAAKKTIEQYGDTCTVRILNNPVREEDSDNRRFLRDIEKWLGVEVETVINPKWKNFSAVEVWEKRSFMANRKGAVCTFELKKQARQIWEKNNRADWLVLGFTADEKARYDRFILTERKTVLPVLIENNLTKEKCFEIINAAGITLPRIYSLGYPNANCIGCVKATSPTYWNHVRKMHPKIFKKRAEQSERMGARLVRVKNKRVLLSELKTTDKGRSMKNYSVECGIFCEEK